MTHRDPVNSSAVIEHEYDSEMPPSIALVQALCVCENVDPREASTEFDFVLRDYIDPEALDAMLGDGTGTGKKGVAFEITSHNTYSVTIRDDGQITIEITPSPDQKE